MAPDSPPWPASMTMRLIASGTAFLSKGRGESSGAADSGVCAMLLGETVPIASLDEVVAVETTREGIAK